MDLTDIPEEFRLEIATEVRLSKAFDEMQAIAEKYDLAGYFSLVAKGEEPGKEAIFVADDKWTFPDWTIFKVVHHKEDDYEVDYQVSHSWSVEVVKDDDSAKYATNECLYALNRGLETCTEDMYYFMCRLDNVKEEAPRLRRNNMKIVKG